MKPSSALRRFLCIASSATSPTARLALLAFATSPLLPFGTAGAQTAYTWNGTTNGTYATTTNWTSGSVAPTTGTTNSRLNVNNTDPARPLTWTGSAIYSGGTGRALVIGSGTNGNMVITGGTFDSRHTTDDIMVNGQFAGSLTINGGNYINTNGGSEIFLVGFNGGASAGAVATLNVESGNFTSGRVQFGQNAGINAGGVVGIVNLNGGILSTKQFHEQGALTNFGDTGITAITSTVNFNGGTLRAIESGTIMKVNAVDNAVVQSGGAIIDTNNFNTTIAKALTAGSPSGGLTKQGAGTLALSAANGYTGATAVDGGTLNIALGGSTHASSSVTVSNSGSAMVVNGTVNGTLVANASTTISGTGTVAGAATVSGNLTPGNSAGLLTFGSSLAMANTTATTMDIAGTTIGDDYDAIVVGTSLTYDGILTLALGATFGAGSYTFDLFDFTSQSGSFDSVALSGLYSGSLVNDGFGVWGATTNSGNETWAFTQSTGDLTLNVIPEPRAALLGGLGLLMLLRRRR